MFFFMIAYCFQPSKGPDNGSTFGSCFRKCVVRRLAQSLIAPLDPGKIRIGLDSNVSKSSVIASSVPVGLTGRAEGDVTRMEDFYLTAFELMVPDPIRADEDLTAVMVVPVVIGTGFEYDIEHSGSIGGIPARYHRFYIDRAAEVRGIGDRLLRMTEDGILDAVGLTAGVLFLL